MAKVTYVTSFYDIGRENWKTFSRSVDEYINAFLPLAELFRKNDPNNDLIVFLDEQYVSRVSEKLGDGNITLIPITGEWMTQHLEMWKTLPKEKELMNSEKNRILTQHRSHCPETRFAEYTLINHCKIDFINYVIDNGLSSAEYYTWVDFGYLTLPCRVPNKLLDVNKLQKDKFNFIGLNNLDDRDRDPIYLIQAAPEKTMGGFFFGNRKVMKECQTLYHEMLRYYQHILGIADDDQAFLIQCYYKRPDLFHIHYLYSWDKALTNFQ